MQFTIAGKRCELDLEDVMETASHVMPDDIDGRHKYYVVIGGRRLPIKQLLAEATGLRRAEFITDEAFRVFRKLGLEVHEFDGLPQPRADLIALDKPKDREMESRSFAVSLEPDEDGYIVASCPQLPGCHSQGRSRQEAIRNIQEAIRGYLASMKRHGEEIPAVDWELVEVTV